MAVPSAPVTAVVRLEFISVAQDLLGSSEATPLLAQPLGATSRYVQREVLSGPQAKEVVET